MIGRSVYFVKVNDGEACREMHKRHPLHDAILDVVSHVYVLQGRYETEVEVDRGLARREVGSTLCVAFVAIEYAELGAFLLADLVQAVRVGEHVEGVDEVELLVADLREVEVLVCTSPALSLLLDLEELQELLIPHACLPGLHHAVVHGYQE